MANSESASNATPSLARLIERLSSNFSSNWRLHLLGLTGLSLSIASGWTTFDGISNFTKSPILSAMITFGIQGVMLVTAWLIGETFANTQSPTEETPKSLRREILGPYVRGIKAILSHIPLWMMFLTCMATSIFFSFDSLFSTIFPQQERARAANLRVTAKVTGLLSDLKAASDQNENELIGKSFASKDWRYFETQIKSLIDLPKNNAADIAAFSKRQNETIIEMRTSVQKMLAAKRAELETEIIKKTQQEPSLQSLNQQIKTQTEDVAKLAATSRDVEKHLAQKRVEAKAETTGVGDSGKAGEGPNYRAITKQIAKLQIDLQAISEQSRQSKKSLENLKRERDAASEHQQRITTKIGTLKSEISVHETRLANTPEPSTNDFVTKTEAQAGLLSQALTTLRQKPNKQNLSLLQTKCSSLTNTLNAIPSLKSQLSNLKCAPDAFSENLSRIENLRAKKRDFEKQCASQTRPKETNALFTHATNCIQSANLPANATNVFQENLRQLNLNRDDQAHRFVVTWNAFLDGNRLAYLALSIAAAIDSLVFMSGLFGASVSTSPLKSSPKAGKRSPAQLDKLLANALSPNKERNANTALRFMTAKTDKSNPNIAAEIDLTRIPLSNQPTIQKALTAGSTIGLVKQNQTVPHRYAIHAQLFEYLASLAAHNKDPQDEGEHIRPAQSIQTTPRHTPSTNRLTKTQQLETRQITFVEDHDFSPSEYRYTEQLLNTLDLENTNLEFVTALSPNHKYLETTIRRWRRSVDPVNQHLRKIENALYEKIEQADADILFSASENPNADRHGDSLDKKKIWSRLIFAETLPLLRDHLRRISEEAILSTDDSTHQSIAENYQQAYQNLANLIEDPGSEAYAKNFTRTLESILRLT